MIKTQIVEPEGVEWLPLSVVAREYNRHPATVRQWCTTGFIIELGYAVRKDLTGHWIIGVPLYLYRNFSETAKTAI